MYIFQSGKNLFKWQRTLYKAKLNQGLFLVHVIVNEFNQFTWGKIQEISTLDITFICILNIALNFKCIPSGKISFQ